MATTRRDIELLISAKETTGRSFSQVTSNIEALNAKIAEQIVQAERGEISLQELRRSQEALAQAGRDLSAIQGQIDAYVKLAASQDKVSASSDKAKADLAGFQKQLEGVEKVSAAQEQKLQRLETAVVKTGAAYEKNTADLVSQTAVLERAGIETKALDAAQAGVVNTARQIGAGLVQVNAAIDGYAANVANARTQEQALAAQSGFERKISEAQQLGNASKFVQLFGDAIQTVAVADNQLAALSGFRAVGQMASEAATDMTRFATAGDSMVSTSAQVAAGLRAILDPGGEALRTLKGVEAAIETAGAQAAGDVKNVGLLSDAYNNLAAASAALFRQGGLIDGFQNQQAAVAKARAEFDAAQADVIRLGQAMHSAEVPTEALARSLAAAEAKLNTTSKALGVESAKLTELNRELKAADINTANLAAEQQRLVTAATTAAASMDKINTTLGRGGRQTNGLFGLKPNDLANLSFQLNDIFVSLASGQNPLIVLIQQGSQIGQIFPGIISTVGRLVLAFSPLIAVVGLVGFAFATAIENADKLNDAQIRLATTAGEVSYDPAAIVAQSDALKDLGVSYEDAAKAIAVFTKEGLDPAKVNEYSEASANLAQVLGIDVAEAAELVNSINIGGIEQLDELQKKTGDLTGAEYDHAKALFEAGKAAEARQYILDIVAKRNQEIADRSRSIWTPAVNNLKQAFSNFGDFLASVIFGKLTTLREAMDNVAIGAAYLFGILAGKGHSGAIDDARKVFDSLASTQAAKGKVAGGSTPQQVRDQQFREELELQKRSSLVEKEMTTQQRLQLAAQRARNDAQSKGVSEGLVGLAVMEATHAEQLKINKEAEQAGRKADAAGRRAEAARRRAAAAAAAEKRKEEGAAQQLENQLRTLSRDSARGGSSSLENRLAAVDLKYEKIFDTISKMRNLGLTKDAFGRPLEDVVKEVEAQKEILQQHEQIKYYEEQAKLLTEQRKDEVEVIADAQERGAKSTTEALEAAQAVNARLSPQIVNAAQQALNIARAVAGTVPSPEMVSMIARLERIVNGEPGNNVAAKVVKDGFSQQEAQFNQAISERNELVSAYNQLKIAGLKTDQEVRDLTVEAYNSSAPLIQKRMEDLRQTLLLMLETKDNLTGLPLITAAAYDAWIAKLDATEAGLVRVDDRITQVNQAAEQGIAQGVTNAFHTAADALAGLIMGTKSWGEAFEDIGRGILGIVGSLLDAIANVLLQMLALKIAKSILGVDGIGGLFFHDGGVVGEGGGSTKRRTGGMGSWAGAPKFHGGGGLGLQPGEYKAVLKRGEEVLTEDDPRHINNLGAANDSGGGGGMPIQQTLIFDPEEIPRAMMGRSGRQAVLTIIKAEKQTVKQMLG